MLNASCGIARLEIQRGDGCMLRTMSEFAGLPTRSLEPAERMASCASTKSSITHVRIDDLHTDRGSRQPTFERGLLRPEQTRCDAWTGLQLRRNRPRCLSPVWLQPTVTPCAMRSRFGTTADHGGSWQRIAWRRCARYVLGKLVSQRDAEATTSDRESVRLTLNGATEAWRVNDFARSSRFSVRLGSC